MEIERQGGCAIFNLKGTYNGIGIPIHNWSRRTIQVID